MSKDRFDQLARELGATFYTNRHYPDGSAVTFNPSQWAKFKAEISNLTIDKPESNLKGGKTGWPPGLLQDDSKKLSQWFASRLDARYVLRSVVFKPFDDHETIAFHKLENKS